jgi:hypothetical protein
VKDTMKIEDKLEFSFDRGLPVEEILHIRGHVEFELRDANGELKERWELDNTVTTAGKNGLADQILAAPTLAKPTHMAIGTGSPSATALGVELDRNALANKTRSGAVITFTATWAAGDGTGTLTEAGVFDAASGGNMWCSTSFAAKPKAAGDTLSATWTFTVG